MLEEDKNLLLKDLCARLLYYPKCEMIDELRVVNNEKDSSYISTLFPKHIELFSYHNNFTIKPYLRSLSSITKEEKEELKSATCPEGTGYFNEQYLICPMSHSSEHISYDFMSDILNWLNAHHFDYRGLIEKDLAIEVTEENNPYKVFT